MTASAARICCLDLDTFFVSVERLLDPSLVGKPVIVGGQPGQRGVVTAASYEVREYGIRSGMSLTEAARLAPPETVFVSGRQTAYGPYSQRVKQVAERFSPVVQTASVDEYFIDFRGTENLYRRSEDPSADHTIDRTVREMNSIIRHEIGLPASAGIATSKPVAKIACGLAKPAGVLLVPVGTEAGLLAPLPVRKYPGIGPVAERKLHRLGIQTLAELAALSADEGRRLFGRWAPRLLRGARGEGEHELGRDRPAFREHDPLGGIAGSISNERTFREDVSDPFCIEAMLCSLAERVAWRARKRGVRARTVTLRLRYADFHTLTRARTIAPTHSELEIIAVVMDLYQKARTRRLPIRLLGVALSKLGFYDEQLCLFHDHRDERLHAAVDTIRERFGFDALRLATGRGGAKKARHLDDR